MHLVLRRSIFAVTAFVAFLGAAPIVRAVNPVFADDTARPLRYAPDHGDFLIESTQGKGEFFNRPLYGSNTAFRVDAGDLPEFMFYLPGRGGNLRLGLRAGNGPAKTKWLHNAGRVIARYHNGMMQYDIHDTLLGNSLLQISAVPMHDSEGLILQIAVQGPVPADAELLWACGGSDGLAGVRRGDIGAESVPVSQFFQLKPENCRGNQLTINGSSFSITGATHTISGVVSGPADAIKLQTVNATQWNNPRALLDSGGEPSASQLIVGHAPLVADTRYLAFQHAGNGRSILTAEQLPEAFQAARQSREKIATAITFDTPDPFINTAAPALCIAGDAVWDEQQGAVMHGAIAWRNKLLGWRGPCLLDDMGWHDRMTRHLTYWAAQQINNPGIPAEPHADPKKNLATDDWLMLHSDGAMSKSHYDMNLAYIDYYLRHALWTGDLALLKKTWPMFQKHLAWEQRCFRRPTGDGGLPLYEAYAAIWASDNLQYDGGGVMHASALNYYHNKMAARIAKLLGENPDPYQKESDAILKAMQRELWIPGQGIFAEFKDLLGPKTLHDSPALWTYYHAVDSEVPDPFQAYQMSRWVDTHIAHIPIHGPNIPDGTSILASTNWMPYIWSINNVCLAENTATALADFQANRPEQAFNLLKGNLLDSMFMGLCPGNAHMASAFDAYRSESQRDFADPTATTTRALVEGLFGIRPDLLAGTLTIQPGFPAAWDHAAITHPDFAFSFKRTGNSDTYIIDSKFATPISLHLTLPARLDKITSLAINGKPAQWAAIESSIGMPRIQIGADISSRWQVEIKWEGHALAPAQKPAILMPGDQFWPHAGIAQIEKIFDPQSCTMSRDPNDLVFVIRRDTLAVLGHHTVFAQLHQGAFRWWSPLNIEVRRPFEILSSTTQDPGNLRFTVRNNTDEPVRRWTTTDASPTTRREITYPPDSYFQDASRHGVDRAPVEEIMTVDAILPGTIPVNIELADGRKIQGAVTNWKTPVPAGTRFDTIDCSKAFNANLVDIFKTGYLSPRSPYVSLNMPRQGIGGWSNNAINPALDDRGLRNAAANNNRITTPQGIPFATPSASGTKNIAFTSFWDNHPKEISIPLTGTARHLYLLMAGTTNPMRSRIQNGQVTVTYADGTTSTLSLRNPENWWPIEQDYFIDDFAFSTHHAPLPPRLDLATGNFRILDHATFAGKGGNIRGGAATLLDMPLNTRELHAITVSPSTYEVIIGLMAVTLVR